MSMPSDVLVRYTEPKDAPYLKKWLMQEDARDTFPKHDEVEVDDAVVRWISFCRFRCSLTIVKEGIPIGIATLYLQPYLRLVHQCEFGIILDPEARGQGLGTILLNHLLHLAKEKFQIELIHLQVYDKNPAAIRFYQRFGFKTFGEQVGWIKEGDGRYGGRLFMERML